MSDPEFIRTADEARDVSVHHSHTDDRQGNPGLSERALQDWASLIDRRCQEHVRFPDYPGGSGPQNWLHDESIRCSSRLYSSLLLFACWLLRYGRFCATVFSISAPFSEGLNNAMR